MPPFSDLRRRIADGGNTQKFRSGALSLAEVCGGTMKIISFIKKATQQSVIEKILRHCGLWMVAEPGRSKEPQPRPPPVEKIPEVARFRREMERM
jgi:hypothetical protein